MSEWQDVRLGDVADILVGYAFKSSHFTTNRDDVRLLRGANIHQGFTDWGKEARWPQTQSYERRYELAEGDVVLAMDRPWIERGLKRARMRAQDLPALLVQRVARLRGTALASTSFIHHTLATEQFSRFLQSQVTGATVPHISQSQIASYPMQLPQREVQAQICAVLDSMDDLIENNLRRVEVLEQMAQAIYRQWFVKFHFPGYEDVPLAESGVGRLPEHWETRIVGEVARVVRGRSYKSTELVIEGGLPFINLKCMARGGGFRRDGLKRYNGPYKEEQLVGTGDLVLAVTDLTQGREILARATLVPRLHDGRGVISLDVIRLVPLDDADRLWLFASLAWSSFADRLKEFANGSTVLHLSPRHVEDAPTLWPPEVLRRRFVDTVEPCLLQIEELSDQSDRLAALRDMLLPKLVTGQIDVSTLDLDALIEGQVA